MPGTLHQAEILFWNKARTEGERRRCSLVYSQPPNHLNVCSKSHGQRQLCLIQSLCSSSARPPPPSHLQQWVQVKRVRDGGRWKPFFKHTVMKFPIQPMNKWVALSPLNIIACLPLAVISLQSHSWSSLPHTPPPRPAPAVSIWASQSTLSAPSRLQRLQAHLDCFSLQ